MKLSKRVLGVDPGLVRVGLAVSDELRLTARPLAVIDRRKPQPAARVVETAVRETAGTIVVGLPLNTDGTEGDSAVKARWFSNKIAEAATPFQIEVVLCDERNSSIEAATLQEQAGRARKSGGIVDDWAAAVLLQSWLDAGCPPSL